MQNDVEVHSPVVSQLIIFETLKSLKKYPAMQTKYVELKYFEENGPVPDIKFLNWSDIF